MKVTRRHAREVALQILNADREASADPELDEELAVNDDAELDDDLGGFADDEPNEDTVEEPPLDPEVERVARELVEGVRAHSAAIESKLHRLAETWSIERLSKAARNLIRVVCYEVRFGGAPLKPIASEAVDLARKLLPKDEVGTLKRVLDSLTVTRRTAREAALQILFQHDLNRDPERGLDEAFAMDQLWHGELEKFAMSLVDGVRANWREIDRVLQSHAQNWSVERMATLDRNVLRLAVYEIKFGGTPPKVVVNEAIELSRKFSTEDSTAFVNGVLDALAGLGGGRRKESPAPSPGSPPPPPVPSEGREPPTE